MKKISCSNSNSRCDSPKTPGGISKSLLTPIRRLGLSRNWKKSGPSAFVSPLSCDNSLNTEIVIEKKHAHKKRAKPAQDNIEEEIIHNAIDNDSLGDCDQAFFESNAVSITPDIVTTPLRAVRTSHKYRSKLLTHALDSLECRPGKEKEVVNIICKRSPILEEDRKYVDLLKKECSLQRVTSKSLRNKGKIKHSSPKQTTKTENIVNISYDTEEVVIDYNKFTEQVASEPTAKDKRPNTLNKECVVVIQKKINKNAPKKEIIPASIEQKPGMSETSEINAVSQALFDSDSDDVPLSRITQKRSNEILPVESKKRSRLPQIDDDFSENSKVSAKVRKLEDKNTSTGDLKTKSKNNILKPCKIPTVIAQPIIHITSSQSSNSFDDDDDFEFDRKKTILIRKTYDKVVKPQKAKSTGSVTQKDIDDLKARIKMKKNMLLAKAMSNDTDELRSLIKKWKKGCQDALIELMDLMKVKFPEKQYMDYSEILQMLKIPSGLVSYDSDNDCFISPDDAGIILSKYKI